MQRTIDNGASLVLGSASEADLAVLMEWFETRTSCRHWGGPAFTFPYSHESFLSDLKWLVYNSFSLVNARGELLGFGQLYEKRNRTHIARVAVNPAHRGEGHGKVLLARLFEAGARLYQHDEYSLYVCADNVLALSWYRREGFEPAKQPHEDAGFDGCVFMVRHTDAMKLLALPKL